MVDSGTGQYLPPEYGKCDHAGSCCYFLSPYKDGYAANAAKTETGKASSNVSSCPDMRTVNKAPNQIENIIPGHVLQSTFKGWEQNVFLQNLQSNIPYPFLASDIEKVRELYQLGTVTKGAWAGAITIPFIDSENKVRAIQVKKFDNQNHTLKTTFLHAICESFYRHNKQPLPRWLIKYLSSDRRVSCLFGEPLLQQFPLNPVCFVEAPKSAVIGTLYTGIPGKPSDFIWLAAYNLSSLTFEKCKVLQGRYVTLFPDLSANGHAYELWKNKAAEFNRKMPDTHFEVSDLIEKNATDEQRAAKEDLADYLIRLDWRTFRKNYNTY
jgi:hypothetical protein